MSTSLLTTHGLSVSIGGKQVCANLDFTLEAGQCWGLLGINGVGKTTLLHTLAGLRPADRGSVMLEQQNITELPRRSVAQQLGVLLQDDTDPFPGTVLETVLMGRHPHLGRWQWESEQDLALARQALTEFELEALCERQINTLSGGERRRLALATLFTQDPQIFLLDEPTNHLDPHHQIQLLTQLRARIRSNKTESPRGLLMILHDINLTTRFCDHVLLLYGEGDVCCGPIEDVLSPENLSRLYGHTMTAVAGPNGPIYIPG